MEAYVTYADLFLYTTVLLSVISLTIAIIRSSKKSKADKKTTARFQIGGCFLTINT